MKVKAVTCNRCGDTMYSRAANDMRWCGCDQVSIDGGFERTAINGTPGTYTEKEIEVSATVKELFNDWERDEDKFGMIKKERAVA